MHVTRRLGTRAAPWELRDRGWRGAVAAMAAARGANLPVPVPVPVPVSPDAGPRSPGYPQRRSRATASAVRASPLPVVEQAVRNDSPAKRSAPVALAPLAAACLSLLAACGSGVPPGLAASDGPPTEQQVMATEPAPGTPQGGHGPRVAYLELQQALGGSGPIEKVLGFYAVTRRQDLDAQAARGGDVLSTLRATRVEKAVVTDERIDADKAVLTVSGAQRDPATTGLAQVDGTVEMVREGDSWRVVKETYQPRGARPASAASKADPSPRTGP